ncbi:hypothetical protein SCLCIDRAFT_25939 [Scleroderma citrinum Foug A]|uniref:Uncharacterized protein n=1 Tax=Scleroderma citrinum Foug A TaxID=1036808 RepID=A0A0C2ZI51_9AGAM|nr:hypothetical protein SCLCIDRAFT_25939 [Scleroderma citrinum Foug A]
MGLLDMNMLMLYGEGKKAFHRLQLEIIRTLNDESIFAWSCNGMELRTGSILADDPSFFRGCNGMELMNRDQFIESLRGDGFRERELPSVEDDRFGTFPITNHGIQIWLYLPHMLALTQSSMPGCHATIALIYWVDQWSSIRLAGNPITIDMEGLVMGRGPHNCVKFFANDIYPVLAKPVSKVHCEMIPLTVRIEFDIEIRPRRSGRGSCKTTASEAFDLELHTTSCVMWKGSRMCGVKLDVFRDPGFGNLSGEWTGFDVDGTDDPNRDWRGLMIRHCPSEEDSCALLIDGVTIVFSRTLDDIKVSTHTSRSHLRHQF